MSEKKVGKRLLTWVLVLVMTLSLLPLNVLAANPAVMRIVRPDTDKYITYEFYNGEAKVAEQIIKTGNTLREPELKAQEGKRLTGWYTENDVLFDGFGEYTDTITTNSTVKLFAKFEDVYYVYFKDTTGRIVATKEGVTGVEIKFDDVSFPVESDESITGWYLESGSDKTVVTSVTLESTNVTLCAIVEKGHWITFDSDGGSYVAPLFVANGTTPTRPADPSKPGYTFDGWYDAQSKYEFNGALSENVELTAKWTAADNTKYTVIHWLENADDDGYSYKEYETKSGTAGELTEDAVDKSYEGFTLDKVEQKEIAGDGSTIVNVYYKRNVYTVTFVSDERGNDIICGKEEHRHIYSDRKWSLFGDTKYKGGCYPSDHYSRYPICGKEEHTHDRSDCYGKLLKDLTITAKYGANISNQWPTYNGSNTWKTSKNGNTYQVNIDTMPLGGATFYGPKTGYGSETAYYYVEVLPGETGTVKNGVTYKLHHSDTSPGTGYRVSKEDKYPITGFTFKDFEATWVNGSLLSDGYHKYDNAKFYYTRNSYNIVYVNSGAEDNKTVSYKFEAPISDAGNYKPTTTPAGKDGYIFDGWYDAPTGGSRFDFANKTMPAQNITVYAKWEAPTFTVTVYDVNKETKLKTFENVSLRGTINKADMPTVNLADGDTFLGWTYKDGTPFNFNTAITKNINLYARVGNKAGYSVTYVTEGSSPVTDDKLYAEGASATVLPGPTAPANKVFLGWTTTKNGTTVNYYPNSSIEITGNVTLYAVYGDKAETVTLTYNANFGTPPASTQISGLKNNGLIDLLSYDELVDGHLLPKRDGYTFTGWNTQQDGHGISFAADTSAARVDKFEPNVLYAQWEKTTIDEEVTVIITGKTDTKVYNGSEQSITGYTTNVGDKAIDVTLKTGKSATASGTDAGKHMMNLKSDDFDVKSDIYTSIKVIVVDGYLEITPITDEVTVTITGNHDSKVYNASEQSVSGYTTDVNGKTISVALKEGSKAEAKGTDVNTYNMGLTADSFTVTSTNYSNIKVVVNDGYLEITPVTDEVTVTITGNTKTVMYNGSEQSVTGYTTDVGDKTIDVVLNATGKDTAKNTKVGKYYMGLTTNDFAVTSTNYTNIKVIVIDGWLEITPITETATVTITGNHNSVKYNGREQSVTGFTYTAPEGVTVAPKDSSKAVAKGTNVGTYKMGLTSKDFTVTSDIYKEFKIIVNDGYLEITRSGGYHPRPKPTVEIEDDDALGLNTTDHFAYIVGYGNGEVRPQNNITRAEVATIFFRLLTDDVRDENLTKTNRYSDVTRADWYNTAVSTLSSMGIITGYPDGTFRPNAAITRAEFAAIAARFDHDGDKTAAKFSDIASHWAKDEISIAYNNGWITGYPNGTFGPQRDITRAETMTLVNRVLNRQPETEDDLLPNMTVWTDNANTKAWYYLAVQEATNSHYYEFKTNSQYEKWTELRETRDWTQLEK